ncbi:pyruvate dehydrogenase complex dihydrolipoamide acetyltransferase [Aequorivita viscosa]|uniref:Acetyltransferase component of pyruvate dehydrogenase complex n=1 Tax=Aequorivita viscosa TaxID=797419 RepID=A0A1M6DTD2_9FLAO|nr:pyruvate dehydrogenase complex dihydrolipoamide acetyltransferase [Aequorivita viscosa]SDW49442.1 pyruvate dehydrogenase E2 component (dihydrolipoamide acetyltransferase) [Aequorivita viscosa]SHI76390.1 pyruvate dehydrogenase E2 component (dihydrolipoamide acetyltransferase) [Aequorivita viscosa]
MAEVINMPRLSDTMEEGTVATWLKKVGDTVKEGDILAEIETDKATMDFESFYEGTLLYIGIEEGETAKVDSLLAIIGDEDEDISKLIDGKSSENEAEVEDEDEDEDEEENDDKKSESKGDDQSSSEADVPEGVEIITMPRLSDTMTEGTVATWLKKEGDKVEEGDILAEIETDKATMEFESFYSGVLLKIGIGEGESAPVDEVLAIIGPEGTDVSSILDNLKGGKSADKAKKSSEDSSKESSKKEKKTSDKKETKPAKPESSQYKSTTTQDSGDRRIFASPLARKMAEEKGIDLRLVQGSAESGRIVKADIANYQPAASAQGYIPVGTESFEEVKNSQMRKTIAKRLSESKFTAPEYYLTVELDMDHAIAAREAINSDPNVKISFNDMIVKACAMALRKHPQVNSQWSPEVTKIANHIHIGVAVAVDEGLLVPVLKFADQMTFSQIGAQVKELAGKARTKKITPQEMEGSTFTVSNLGMFGIKEFTSIINQPNSAILSVGAIIQKPVVKNGQIAVGNTMTVTLACDHRTVDGATGAKFMQTLRQYIENPVTMFV